jgi:nucleotide-binding universal stress UspA family protein
MEFVYCCVDSDNYCEDSCDYAVMIANNLNVSLKFLNVVEHSQSVKDLDLTGNIGLGAKENVLEDLANKEQEDSKCSIMNGKRILQKLENRAKENCKNSVEIKQVHGDIVETIFEHQNDMAVLVIGLKSNLEHSIGENVKDIIRAIHKPVLLVNSKFSIPNKLMIAYNGSNESRKLIETTSQRQIFKDAKREIVNLNKYEANSYDVLNEAKTTFENSGIKVSTKHLGGENEDTLLDYFNETNSDILGMGAFGHSRFKELFFGSFTTKILTKMNKPILLFR